MTPRPCKIEVITVEEVRSAKKPDCANYNQCMSLADRENWNAFGCAECQAYELPDPEQRFHDMLQLLVLNAASHNAVEFGCAGRKPGVKEGSVRKAA